MAASDPLDILLRHDSWATGQLLDACEHLSNEQFHQSFEMGPGSLHDTITHILGAMRSWGDLLAGRDFRDRPEGSQFSIESLRQMLQDAADDLRASATAHPNDEVLSRERGGRVYSFTRGAVLTHVATHGMHHRAQCLNMLRQLGADAQPPSSVMQWTMMADA